MGAKPSEQSEQPESNQKPRAPCAPKVHKHPCADIVKTVRADARRTNVQKRSQSCVLTSMGDRHACCPVGSDAAVPDVPAGCRWWSFERNPPQKRRACKDSNLTTQDGQTVTFRELCDARKQLRRFGSEGICYRASDACQIAQIAPIGIGYVMES